MDTLCRRIVTALEDLKAEDVRVFDVRKLTDVADTIVLAGGSSSRKMRAMVERVTQAASDCGVRCLGVEGQDYGEWVLVDLGDAIVHLMSPSARAYYQLEKLWMAPEHPVTTALR